MTKKTKLFNDIEDLGMPDNIISFKQLATLINKGTPYEGKTSLGFLCIPLYDSNSYLRSPKGEDKRYLENLDWGIWQLCK